MSQKQYQRTGWKAALVILWEDYEVKEWIQQDRESYPFPLMAVSYFIVTNSDDFPFLV